MGILNVTPDSFSDGGKFFAIESAVKHAAQLVADGANILDIGAESTRPGHETVTLEEESARLLPVLREVRKCFPALKISVDTYKGELAKAAVEAGADIINDVWGGMRKIFFGENGLSTAEVSAHYDCPIILMHNKPQETLPMHNLNAEIFTDFEKILENANALGVDPKNIILDGGFGFAKTPEQNIELLKNYGTLRRFGFPLLLGLSKKSTLKKYFGEEAAAAATLAFDMWAACNKVCDIIRIHDVTEHSRLLKPLDSIDDTIQWTN